MNSDDCCRVVQKKKSARNQKLNPAEICFGTLATEYQHPRPAHSATNPGALDAGAMTAAEAAVSSCRIPSYPSSFSET